MNRINHRFTFYWVPNLVTFFNLFSGFFSIVMAAKGNLQPAAWLIFCSFVWDSLDGNIARALKNPSSFGRELDSLADIVSFVTAPPLLVLALWSYQLNFWTIPTLFIFLASGAYRLARFNLRPPIKDAFEGLPTPAAAVAVAMTVAAYTKNPITNLFHFTFVLIALMFFMSFLMVSRVPYPKFSAIQFSRWRSLFVPGMIFSVTVSILINLETGLAFLSLLFITIGPLYSPRRAAKKIEPDLALKTHP